MRSRATLFLLGLLRRRGDARTTTAREDDATDALMERRARRRASMELPEDPIVAALGLGEETRRGPRSRGSAEHPSRERSGSER